MATTRDQYRIRLPRGRHVHAAEYLRRKYGADDPAATDLLRLAELEARGESALGGTS